MTSYPADNPQAAIDHLPTPNNGSTNRGGSRVPPEDRFTYRTPNLSDNTTPDKNPAATTHYPMKSGPGNVA